MEAVSSLSETLGFNIKRLRKVKGFSQENLAETIGASRDTIARLEAGNSGFTLNTIENLSKALSCGELDFFRDKDFEPSPREAVEVLARFVQQFDGVPASVLNALSEVEWDREMELLIGAAIKGTVTGDLISREKQVKHRKKRA